MAAPRVIRPESGNSEKLGNPVKGEGSQRGTPLGDAALQESDRDERPEKLHESGTMRASPRPREADQRRATAGTGRPARRPRGGLRDLPTPARKTGRPTPGN